MQRVDDMTGVPIAPLSAREREKERLAMIAQINQQTRELNAHTARLREVTDRLTRLDRTLQEQSTATVALFASLYSRAFMARLRWLFLGR